MVAAFRVHWQGIALPRTCRRIGPQDKTQDNLINPLRKLNDMVCHETYYIIKHCTNNTCFRSSKLQTVTSHSLANIPPFYPSLIVTRIPISGVLCLSACLFIALFIRMAVGMNDCRYRAVLLRAVLNLRSLISL